MLARCSRGIQPISAAVPSLCIRTAADSCKALQFVSFFLCRVDVWEIGWAGFEVGHSKPNVVYGNELHKLSMPAVSPGQAYYCFQPQGEGCFASQRPAFLDVDNTCQLGMANKGQSLPKELLDFGVDLLDIVWVVSHLRA